MTLILLINTDHYNQRKSCSIRVISVPYCPKPVGKTQTLNLKL
jgi:hypothetical protein